MFSTPKAAFGRVNAALPNGFRFDGAGRFLSLDIDLTTAAPEPATLGLAAAAGTTLLARRRRA